MDLDKLETMNIEDFDQDQAIAEGWCISYVSAHSTLPEGWYRIERWDDNPRFKKGDYEAIAFVAEQAANRSEYHMMALELVDIVNSRHLDNA